MLGVMNKEQQDFGRNWLRHVRALKLGYYVVGAMDANTSVLLTELKVSTVIRGLGRLKVTWLVG